MKPTCRRYRDMIYLGIELLLLNIHCKNYRGKKEWSLPALLYKFGFKTKL